MASNKDIIRRLFRDVLNRNNSAAITEIISEDYHEQDSLPGQVQGIIGIEQRLILIINSFPDAVYQIEDMISEGEKISVRWKMNAVFKNKFLFIEPTGKPVEMKGIDIYYIKDGKIYTHWNEVDMSCLGKK
ncbi:MAG: ester cyclase [Bacteroidetes bacterium]|nr:ester cyclase [Bacteroidota bacterium]